jgi:hypothetical protein
MLSWLLAFTVTGFGPLIPEGLPVAPVDVVAGAQTIALRAPLVARTPGVRLVLFVRDLSAFAAQRSDRLVAFEQALPPGSVKARLRSSDGRELELRHTDYVYHRGYAGLVLTETAPGLGNTLYGTLEIDAATALPGVQFVWLDRLVRTVQDTRQLR